MPRRHLALLFALPVLLGGRVDLDGQAGPPPVSIDREYRLEATMLGYRGIGGTIAGIRNPTLWARTGETVRITIVNGEVMVHDIALEKQPVKSRQILERGETASITFKAVQSDTYYCSLPGHRISGMEGRLDVSDEPRTTSDEGTAPAVGQRTLNLDFESGSLADWTATGDAFTVVKAAGRSPELRDAPDDRAGEFWVSSRPGGAAKRGVLTSAPFPVTHPYASFLISGGAFRTTRVEIVRVEDGRPLFTVSGSDAASLRPVVVDLRAQASKSIVIRVVDDETGAPTASYLEVSPWAHVAFDRFRFHDVRPFFPDEVTPSESSALPPLETATHAGLSGADAARAMTVPEGFTVTLAAAEPDVVRPIAFALDDRGRLWVAEAHSYPLRAPEGEGRDRILIFEDTDGDGRLDRRKVFTDKLNLVSGLEVGFGGVWVGAAPNLLFIPMKPGSDRPSGPPRVLLDGWGYEDTHETLNTFRWGPDGWLYGTHGVFTHSNVGKPGTPEADRTPLNGGVWRYHPTRHVFERFAEGTSNPWGLDFNEYGHAFATACVIEHLYHVVQGGRYKRQANTHFNLHTYDDIETIADHRHWVGDKGPHAGNGRSGAAGGGHAHAGAMIYLGGDGWPAEYRNAILMHNIHGFRANMDRLKRSGSGYTASHGPDFLLANDAWSQMLNFQYGPDGSVHVIDWYDKNQCHSTNPELHQKTMGRIFKISHASDRPVRVDLARLSSSELVAMQLHRNDWYVQHARRLLQERGPDAAVHAGLKKLLAAQTDDTRRLRALWALHVTGGLTEGDRVALLADPSEYVRGWAITLLVEDSRPSDTALRRFVTLARDDASALVRLQLASALQRVPVEQRWDVVTALAGRAADAADGNQALMLWYAAEPLVPRDMTRALDLAADAALSRLFAFTVQRIADVGTPRALLVLSDRLGRTTDTEHQRALLSGITQIVNKPAADASAQQAPAFRRIQLHDQFWSEGASAADLNNDGAVDVIAGPWWWEGPAFTTRHEFYPARTSFQRTVGPTRVTVPGFEGALGTENTYSDNFFVFPHDFNGDRWTDLLVVGFPGKETSWYENPKGGEAHWRRHIVFEQTDNESPTFADLTGDGKPELVCITKGRFGYASPDWADPAKPWTFHAITPDNKYGNFTHGLGVGDVDGDKRLDLLEKNGWWQQPASLAGDPVWRFHPQPMGEGGAQMHAYDVNGDGLNDIVTGLAAHGFGLAWFEQYREGGAIAFRPHVFMNKTPAENRHGVKFSELHAIELVDVDGDGLQDIVTGKRYWSHGRTGDPDRNDDAVLYWFKLVRAKDGSVDFVPHLIDKDSGAGTQVVVTDIDGDKRPDIVVGNKKGAFVHLQTKKAGDSPAR